MSSSIIALLNNEKLTNKHYASWNSKLNIIIVINDLCFVLMEEYPLFLTQNAF